MAKVKGKKIILKAAKEKALKSIYVDGQIIQTENQ